jgi:aminoglycoside/choline kinase family phosphotransferase
MIGSPAYDMVSFLEDARRDVAPETVTGIIDHYLKQTKLPRDEFMTAYKILGAQRNFRIIGTFARLNVRDGKERYLAYMPRVWKHIENDLSHPVLAPIKDWLEKHIRPQWRHQQ